MPESMTDMAQVRQELQKFKLDLHPLQKKVISPKAIDLVLKCLTVDPQKRLTIKTVLKHGWFKTA